MKVKTYNPRIQVLLHRTISREKIADSAPVSARFKGSAQVIDLTPFLSETSGVQTSKSIHDPAGVFSLVLADKPFGAPIGFDSLYGLVEPMHMVEIRMLHDAQEGALPVVMRGFVSRVVRSEAIDGSGRPVRTVVVTGQDWGRLWQQLEIRYYPGYVTGQDILSNFKLFERYGIGFQTNMSGSEFVQQMVEKVLNPYLAKMLPENTTLPKGLALDLTAKRGRISVDGPQERQGTVYDLLRYYLDVGPWCELFIDDRQEGPTVVYRENPFKSAAGKKINPDSPDAEVVEVLGEDVEALQVERTADGVANYFWVSAPAFDMAGDYGRSLWADPRDRETAVDLSKYPNTASSLYGIKLMSLATQMCPDDVKTSNTGLPPKETRERDTSVAGWCYERRKFLAEANKDNVVFEHGTMRVRGNEKIRPGCRIQLKRGGFSSEYYVEAVSHEFVPFQSFKTTLQVTRGTGFIERARREGGADSPYLAELQGLR